MTGDRSGGVDPIEDPLLGRLNHDGDSRMFVARITWQGVPIELNLECDDGDVVGLIAAVSQLISDEQRWTAEIHDLIIEQLLVLKNDTWLDEGEEPLSAAQFLARVRLESLTVSPDASFDFMFADGDIFWGHWISVSGSLSDGVEFAEILG